jgi:hypothetical protein
MDFSPLKVLYLYKHLRWISCFCLSTISDPFGSQHVVNKRMT